MPKTFTTKSLGELNCAKVSLVLSIVGQLLLTVCLAFVPPLMVGIVCHQFFGWATTLLFFVIAFGGSFYLAFLLAGYLDDLDRKRAIFTTL